LKKTELAQQLTGLNQGWLVGYYYYYYYYYFILGVAGSLSKIDFSNNQKFQQIS